MVYYLLSTLFFLNLIASSVYLLFKALLVWAKNGVNERFRYIGCIAVMVLFLIPFYQALPISSTIKDMPFQTSGYLEGVSSVIPKDEVVQKNTSITESKSTRTSGFCLDVQAQEKILLVWSVGVSALALWYIAVLLRFRRRLSQKQTQPVCGELQRIANHCASEYGIRQTPILRASPHVQSPVLIGFFKPIIAVPADGLPPADVQMILKHELVHFKRRDLWWKLLGVVIQTIHWANPIVWLLCKDFEFCAETSCDAQVVQNLDHDGRKSYGYLLISYSQFQHKLNSTPGISFISSREKLKRRICIMLNIQQYRLTGKFINFLLTIAVNTCNNHFKKKSPDLVDMDTLSTVESSVNVSEEILRQEDTQIIQQALDRLPDIQKEVVILRFYHDRKLKEIAAITGVSLPTAKSRLKQGLDKLKRYLDKEDFKA